jgi:lycopene cyclase domain-containing protein
MDRWQYLLLMAGCLLITLPLEFVLGARVYRSPRRLWRALWPMLGVFVAWDLIVIARDHWTFSERYTTGLVFPGGVPLEEVVFFIVIPICGLLSLEAVRRILGLLAARRSKDA